MIRHALFGLCAGVVFLLMLLAGWNSRGNRTGAYSNPLRAWIDWSKTGSALEIDVVAKCSVAVLSVAFVVAMIHWWAQAIETKPPADGPLRLGLRDDEASPPEEKPTDGKRGASDKT